MKARYYSVCHEVECKFPSKQIKPGQFVAQARAGLPYSHTACLNKRVVNSFGVDCGDETLYMCITCGKNQVKEVMQTCDICLMD